MTAATGGTTAAAATGRQSRLTELLRAGAAPFACGLVLVAVLAGWVLTGGGGTVSRVRVSITRAAIPMPAFTAARGRGRDAAAYLTIRNLTGNVDVLVSASSPAAARVVLTRQAGGTPDPVPGGLTIPAGSSISFSPFGPDLVLVRPRLPAAGQTVLLRLRFREAGLVTVEATVTPPGTP